MRKAESENDRKLLADIQEFGWHTGGVRGGDQGPSYVFTVGLFYTFQHPELCIFGLSSIETMGVILNDAGEMVRENHTFQDGESNSDLLADHTCIFKQVQSKYIDDYFGYARWFYEEKDFPVLQCVWPDKKHKYPWHQDFAEGLRDFQPSLY